MIDKYQQLCEYIMELDENNQTALQKVRKEHDVYGNLYYEELAIEDTIYLLSKKIKEINGNS